MTDNTCAEHSRSGVVSAAGSRRAACRAAVAIETGRGPRDRAIAGSFGFGAGPPRGSARPMVGPERIGSSAIRREAEAHQTSVAAQRLGPSDCRDHRARSGTDLLRQPRGQQTV